MNSILHQFVLNYQLLYFAGALVRVMLSVEVIRHLRVKRSILCRSLFDEVCGLRCFVHLRATLSKRLLLLLELQTHALTAYAVLWICSRCLSWLIRLPAASKPLTISDATFLLHLYLIVDLQQLLWNAWHLSRRSSSSSVVIRKTDWIRYSILLTNQSIAWALLILDSLIQAWLKIIGIRNRYSTAFKSSAFIQLCSISFLVAVAHLDL